MKVIPPITISNTEGSFTRSTTATYFDKYGVMQTAAVNTPRITYNPATLACQGVLYEPARTNLVTYSNQFDNAVWTKTNVTLVADAILAVDGTNTVYRLVASAVSGRHWVSHAASCTSGLVYAMSVYAKAGGYNFISLTTGSTIFGSNQWATFDLSDGTISSEGSTDVNPTITDVGNGWYRVTISPTATSSASTNAFTADFFASDPGTRVPSSLGDGISGIYIWGVQVETGSFETSYISTVASTVIRAADTFTGVSPCVVYSNVTAPSGYTTWSSGSAYATGAKVFRASTNCIYQCIKDIIVGSTNSTILPEASILLDIPYWVRLDALPWVSGTTYTYSAASPVQVTYLNRTYEIIATTTVNTTLPTSTSPTYWFDVGPSNRWGVFDYLRNSTSNIKTQMVISVATGSRVDSAVLVGLAEIVNAVVTIYSPSLGTTSYNINRTLSTKASTTWYDYFFTSSSTIKSAVFSDLPPYTDAIVSVVLLGDNIQCGGIILGKAQELGAIQRGATSEIINFSTVTRDTFGNATMVQRRNIPKTNQTLYLDKSYVNAVRLIRDQLNASPAAWVGLEDLPDQYYFEALLIVGFYRTFTINIDNPIGVIINLELEEI